MPPGQARTICHRPGQGRHPRAVSRSKGEQSAAAGSLFPVNTGLAYTGPWPPCRPHQQHGGKKPWDKLLPCGPPEWDGGMTAPRGVLSSFEGLCPSWPPQGGPHTGKAACSCTKALTLPCLCGLGQQFFFRIKLFV